MQVRLCRSHRIHSGSGATPLVFDALADTVRILVRALDDAIEVSLTHNHTAFRAQVMGAKTQDRRRCVRAGRPADLVLPSDLSDRISPDSSTIRTLSSAANTAERLIVIPPAQEPAQP
jgi:hypothetical protein